ncbi:MAG: ATP-binding protein [archaeon]
MVKKVKETVVKVKETIVTDDFPSTDKVQVSKKLMGQVIGQDSAVELMKKAAAQKRNVLLIGDPGTGKSMLAQAMSEVMPVQELFDVMVYPNELDSNNPKVRTTKAGEGQQIVQKERLSAKSFDDNMRMISFLLPLGFFIFSSVIWQLGFISDVIYAATLLLGGIILIAAVLGSQLKVRATKTAPKLLINNAGKKVAPFIEATGAKAGALFGDCRHDPLQSFIDEDKFVVVRGNKEEKLTFEQLWKEMSEKHSDLVEKHENDYEAIVFPKDVNVFTYGLNSEGEVVKTRIYSMNRRPYNSEVVEVTANNSKLTVTPEHKVKTKGGDKKAVEVSEKDSLIRLFDSKVNY